MRPSPPDGIVKHNSFTRVVYRDTYPAVDPRRPQLSQHGRVILITGASKGIGLAAAIAFAVAGAKAIVITARTVANLQDAAVQIKKASPLVEVLPLALEISDEASVQSFYSAVAVKYPRIDVLVNNAGIYASSGQFLNSLDSGIWWREFEVNVKGTVLVTRGFLSQLDSEARSSELKPAIVYISSSAGLAVMPGSSAYSIAKLADLRLAAYAAAENPKVQITSVHPGMIDTDLMTDDLRPFAKDTLDLAASVVNWLTTPEATFMQGRFMSANWDVAELLDRKDEIVRQDLMKLSLSGLVGTVAEVKI